jgi:hypothetical protein
MKIWFLSWVIFAPFWMQGQKVFPQNLSDFDDNPFHFGFLVSGNRSFFDIKYKPDFTFNDSLLSAVNVPQAGFNLALLASYNPWKPVSLRFIPGLSFQDRAIAYRFLKANEKVEDVMVRTSSVWLEFPLLLKMRTDRIGNFAAYSLVGGKYAIDMQTQKDVNSALAGEGIIKLSNKDYCLEIGGGMDFFMPFFKFATEFKVSYGFPNLIIQDGSRYTTPIEALKTRAYVFTISFEG